MPDTMQGSNPSDAASKARVALVTGAASGIGRSVAEILALEHGVAVYVLDRDAQAVDAVVRALAERGARAAACVVDLADTEGLQQGLPTLMTAFGPPDMLVNNAGIAAMIPVLDTPLAYWQQTFAVNVTAPMLLSQFVLPHMRDQGWGRIVNVASISGMRAGTGRLAYGSSKGAIIAMTKQFAIETAEWGVTVNAVAPGPIDTPMTVAHHTQATRDLFYRQAPMARYGTPREVAHAILFLLSAQADYITGHTLPVDGGFMAAGALVREDA